MEGREGVMNGGSKFADTNVQAVYAPCHVSKGKRPRGGQQW